MNLPSLPQDVKVQAVTALVESGKEPSPSNLIAESKKKKHPLHGFFWDTPESTWAEVGRYEGARRILQTTKVDLSIGGKSISMRAVEFCRDQDGGRWASMQDIVNSDELRRGYMTEVNRLLQSAQEKMARLIDLTD